MTPEYGMEAWEVLWLHERGYEAAKLFVENRILRIPPKSGGIVIYYPQTI